MAARYLLAGWDVKERQISADTRRDKTFLMDKLWSSI
jgi:hypothetical protein